MTVPITAFEIIKRFMDREDADADCIRSLTKTISDLGSKIETLTDKLASKDKDLSAAYRTLETMRSALYQGQNEYDNIRGDSYETVGEWIVYCSENFCAFPNLSERQPRQTLEELVAAVQNDKQKDQTDESI